MNVFYLVYTTSRNGKQYQINIVHPTTGADTTTFEYYQNGAFAAITSSNSNYPTVPEGQSCQISYTPDGQYLVMATSKGIMGFLQLGGGAMQQLTLPTVTTGFNDAEISSDSNFVVGVNQFAPYAVCYQRGANNTFTSAGNLQTLQTAPASCCDFSAGGNYLAVGGSVLYLYSKTGSTFTSLTVPVINSINCVKFSADTTILYVGTTNGVVVLNRVGSTFVVNSATYSGNIQGIDVYSKYLAVTTTSNVVVYDTTTQTAVYTNTITNAKSVKFSPDGLHIGVEQTSAPYFEVQQWQQ